MGLRDRDRKLLELRFQPPFYGHLPETEDAPLLLSLWAPRVHGGKLPGVRGRLAPSATQVSRGSSRGHQAKATREASRSAEIADARRPGEIVGHAPRDRIARAVDRPVDPR